MAQSDFAEEIEYPEELDFYCTTSLSIDVSTEDVITPDAVKYKVSGIFDEDIFFTTTFCI